MPAGPLQLPVGSYKLPSAQAGSQLLLNCYAEQARSGKQKLLLRRAPGISDFCEVAGDLISARGGLYTGGVLYAVIGSGFYSIAANGVETLLSGATDIVGNERVIISVNNAGDIFIVTPANGLGYTWDGSVFQQETDPVFTGFGAFSVGFIDGYFVFPVPGSAQFFNSGLNAPTYSALDVATAEGAPGNLVGFIIDHRELFLAKEETIELWYDAGNSPGSPFSRSPNGFLQIGLAAPGAITQQDNSIFWLANDKTIRRLDGGTPARVSQHGIETAIQAMATISDCYAMSYTQEGHLFAAFTFPSESRTFVYDCVTQEWADRDSLINGVSNAWRPSFIINAYGKQIVGDSRSGRLGYLDPSTHEEFGDAQRVRWDYQGVYAERNRVQHKRLELVLNAGSGTLTGQGQNPLATLKVSDDGGQTFRTLPTRAIGRRGNYTIRVYWWQLGMSRDRVYRMEITDPVPLFATDTILDAEGARL